MAKPLSKKAAYKFLVLAADSDPKAQIEQAYVLAYQKGYSTVEIARLGGFKSAKFVHASLVKHGIIPHGKSGPQPKGTIPKKMRIHLTTRGLTFSQWCAGWGLDQVEAKEEVDELSGRAMAAIKLDFPGYYKLLTGAEVDDYARPAVKFEKQLLSVKIEWDTKEGCYRTDILPGGSVGYGPNLQTSLKAAQLGVWTLEIAKRLAVLPDKKDIEREPIW